MSAHQLSLFPPPLTDRWVRQNSHRSEDLLTVCCQPGSVAANFVGSEVMLPLPPGRPRTFTLRTLCRIVYSYAYSILCSDPQIKVRFEHFYTPSHCLPNFLESVEHKLCREPQNTASGPKCEPCTQLGTAQLCFPSFGRLNTSLWWCRSFPRELSVFIMR